MNNEGIELKTVNDLRTTSNGAPRQFFVPAYQRGYRWSTSQVEQLLNDVRDFTYRPNPQPEEFYCLQPLVIMEQSTGVFEVVDGQQRLTTLLLVLRHFNERLAERYRLVPFTLSYETRRDLQQFLAAPDQCKSSENVDYFHLSRAMQKIEAWFEERESVNDAIYYALRVK